ncbi:serine--tRNA ligase [Kamptonema cortianum]|nr:serine--tRNA ligase [Oscillatoria laete-virens]MDK3160236.1 serine--tRNA ligase [Kamptonema cortianum]MDL5048410.1 serine--tRNA ligase [Oscillatoria amoena NRMC-F 0135]MDL5055679.1 serine--tRNA ligase [Oscillatoria laete-virens NRMC-F 0139]
MLDIKYIRENPEIARQRLASRHQGHEIRIDELLFLDERRRKLLTEVEALKAEKNRVSKEVGKLKSQGQPVEHIFAQMKEHSDKISELDKQVAIVEEDQRKLLLTVPNLPHPSVPDGRDAADNPEVKVWGDKPAFDFTPKNHIDLCGQLGLVDFERAAKLAGSGFALYTGLGARLERALINLMLDTHTGQHGYSEVLPPFIANAESLTGTGQLPKFADQLFKIDGHDKYLIPTAEVPVANLHRDEILPESDLPRAYVAYTPCFRSEAGAAGVGTRGLLRMHQFDKVELVRIVKPEDGDTAHQEMLSHAEKILQLLGLHYRIIVLCTGDMGFGMAKTYDIEIWAPGQNAYLEVSSVSNAEDYQARRMNLRFKRKDAKHTEFPHILNGSGVALARLYVAFIETYQQADGSILLPEILQPFMGGLKQIAAS